MFTKLSDWRKRELGLLRSPHSAYVQWRSRKVRLESVLRAQSGLGVRLVLRT